MAMSEKSIWRPIETAPLGEIVSIRDGYRIATAWCYQRGTYKSWSLTESGSHAIDDSPGFEPGEWAPVPVFQDEAITHGGADRRHKLCKCSKCGIREYCSPHADFYTVDAEDKGPLLCSYCLERSPRA